MPQGYDLEPHLVNLNDTALLTAVLYDATGKPQAAANLASVVFTVQDPNQIQTTVTGLIAPDGSGTATYKGTSTVGHYIAVAAFTDINGTVQSVRTDFDVEDPFLTHPNFSPTYLVATQIWAKIEDCFDPEDGGPWLTEMTQNIFNREKMESFLDIALFDLNNLNPPTNLGVGDFVTVTSGVAQATTDLPVLTQGAYIACLRHLMASYVEQPSPTGAQIAWQDRRDYLSRWTTVYTIEFSVYDRMAKLFKRRFLGLGQTKGLVSSKAGRLLPAPMRSRSVGRGYW